MYISRTFSRNYFRSMEWKMILKQKWSSAGYAGRTVKGCVNFLFVFNLLSFATSFGRSLRLWGRIFLRSFPYIFFVCTRNTIIAIQYRYKGILIGTHVAQKRLMLFFYILFWVFLRQRHSVCMISFNCALNHSISMISFIVQ